MNDARSGWMWESLRTTTAVVVSLLLLFVVVSPGWMGPSSLSAKSTKGDRTIPPPLDVPREIQRDARCHRRQAAILLFGRVKERTVVVHPFEHHVRALRRVRGDIERHVIQPNSHLYNFTVIVRVEDPADVTLVRTVFTPRALGGGISNISGDGLNRSEDLHLVLATEPMERSIEEPSVYFCKYRMWSNIQVAVQALRATAEAYLRDRVPCFALPVGSSLAGDNTAETVFDWVLVFRSEIVINTPFVLSNLNSELFYVANMCAVQRRGKKRIVETVYTKRIPCLRNEVTPISFWPQERGQPPTTLAPVLSSDININNKSTCESHTLTCKKLMRMRRADEAGMLMPDFFFAANATTMSIMFYHIVDDWHDGKFRKAAAQCNHGLLGGRLLHRHGVVRTGRYKYHKIDVEIPRYASWYPNPSLVEYLANRKELWDTPGGMSPDDALPSRVRMPAFESRCEIGSVCLLPEAALYN